jgi:hypothetical protein
LIEKIKTARGDTQSLAALLARMESQLTNLPGKVFGKQAIYVECSKDQCKVGAIATEGADAGLLHPMAEFAGAEWHKNLLAWARQRASRQGQEAFVLLIRPDAADKWSVLHRALAMLGFDVGWDVWPEPRRLFKPPGGGPSNG